MSERATCWSVTINNPISADDDNIARAKQKSGWKVEGQLEEGENGTKHYQLMVKTPQTRFSALKTAFPRAHIEVARNVKALSSYVHKESTKIGELPVNDKYPSMSKFWEIFTEHIVEKFPKGGYEDWDQDQFLIYFDMVISDMIMEGYFVESFGVNPQVRSSIKKYGFAILRRTAEIIRRQNEDRQTIIIPEDESIKDEESLQSETQSQSSHTSQSTDWSSSSRSTT